MPCPVPKFWAIIGVVCTLTVESADSSQGPPRPCLLTNVSFMKKMRAHFCRETDFRESLLTIITLQNPVVITEKDCKQSAKPAEANFAVCVSQDTHKTKTLTCHPERTKYAKLFAVEQSEQQKVEPLAAKRSTNA